MRTPRDIPGVSMIERGAVLVRRRGSAVCHRASGEHDGCVPAYWGGWGGGGAPSGPCEPAVGKAVREYRPYIDTYDGDV